MNQALPFLPWLTAATRPESVLDKLSRYEIVEDKNDVNSF